MFFFGQMTYFVGIFRLVLDAVTNLKNFPKLCIHYNQC